MRTSYWLRAVLLGDQAHNQDGGLEQDTKWGQFGLVCDQASRNLENDYVIAFDEINSGNITELLGDLLTQIEKDKRWNGRSGQRVRLPYSGKLFGVPPNVYIIGPMNTADKSLTLVDYALRRRFAFLRLEPRYDLFNDEDDSMRRRLKNGLHQLNAIIEKTMGVDYLIGHSYFLSAAAHGESDQERATAQPNGESADRAAFDGVLLQRPKNTSSNA